MPEGAFHLHRITSELGNTGPHLRRFSGTCKSTLAQLFFTNYRYRREATANANIWRCVKKDCKARLTTNEDDAIIIGEKNTHNHDPESEEDILRLELKMKSRKRALVEKNEPPSKVIIKEVTEMASENQDFISAADTKAIRQAVYREGRKIYPTLPKSLMESIEKVGFLSSAGENMVCLNDKVSGIVLFRSKSD
ncbi:ketoisovalerate oxidoreductase subunit vorD [Elysia marginata]|uniref:Ketoisovalerate oxidoreductase subunit vorD n=1 Tax=Elysia marginata TaxID=1093978 RepID=A0AAV4JXA7_9GAST|nr:ketoisovalerate oxidoreductase subunit vorD [Elysia marginata]